MDFSLSGVQHPAFGFIDMGKGIDGLAMLVQGVLRRIPSRATFSCSPIIILSSPMQQIE